MLVKLIPLQQENQVAEQQVAKLVIEKETLEEKCKAHVESLQEELLVRKQHHVPLRTF